MDVLLWLFEGGQLPLYWSKFAEPKILRNYGYEDAVPAQLRADESLFPQAIREKGVQTNQV